MKANLLRLGFKKWFNHVITFTLALSSLGVGLCCLTLTSSAQSNLAPPDFIGKTLLALSDGDMKASAYADGKLGSNAGPDALSVIQLRAGAVQTNIIANAAVSNSVTGPPSSIAVTRDGHYAVVIETQGGRPAGKPAAMLSDLSAGTQIAVIDIRDPLRPKITQVFKGTQSRPVSVDINENGDLVAVAYDGKNGKQKSLAFFRLSEGHIFGPVMPEVPGWSDKDDVVTASFYKNDILVIVNIGNPSLTFLQISGSVETGLALKRWGNDVGLDKAPFLVRFTADGKTALVNSMYFGPDVSSSPRGTVTAIRIADHQNSAGAPVHYLVSRAEAGYEPEGMAVSPDGNWVVTANLERSWKPITDPDQTFFSSLTLFKLDTSGRLTRVGEFCFSGILPETVVFDHSGKYLAVTVFDHYTGPGNNGSVDFWKLCGDNREPGRVELIRTDYSVPLPKGVHSMVVLK